MFVAEQHSLRGAPLTAGHMGRPILLDAMERPVTSFVIALCTLIWYHLNSKGLGYEEVGMSYEKVVRARQYWRCVTASFSHISPLHLLFNMSTLWSLGVVEQMRGRGEGWGSGWYVRYTLVMLVGTMACVILAYHVLVRMGHERYERVTAVGYSCVVFGWMTVLSVRQPTSSISLLGYVQLPVNLAPFGSLLFTSMIVPQASFVGHLMGIVMGYAVAWGMFAWVNWWWTGVLAVATSAAFVTSLHATTDFEIPMARRLATAFRRQVAATGGTGDVDGSSSFVGVGRKLGSSNADSSNV